MGRWQRVVGAWTVASENEAACGSAAVADGAILEGGHCPHAATAGALCASGWSRRRSWISVETGSIGRIGPGSLRLGLVATECPRSLGDRSLRNRLDPAGEPKGHTNFVELASGHRQHGRYGVGSGNFETVPV